METILLELLKDSAPKNNVVLDNETVADMLQNDISQTLAAVLLWLQTGMEQEGLASNEHLQLAETNLKLSIKKLVRLHYALLQ
ncbi:MAG TPA: hypothetical protein VKI61_08130 [Chitinophagaceae bacterium]|jgi:hypothetical protein|nr:hypothetical protein [Chitinophagaceae bacterium]